MDHFLEKMAKNTEVIHSVFFLVAKIDDCFKNYMDHFSNLSYRVSKLNPFQK